MKKGKKIALITAGCMVLAGLILALGGLAAVRFDITRLNTVSYQTNTYEIGEAFHNITIEGGSCDVRLYPSENDTCRVVCTAEDDVDFTVEVGDDTLHIQRQDTKVRFLYFDIYWGETGISVYLPRSDYESLSIRTTSGDVEVPEFFSFPSADIQCGSGEVRLLASVGDTLSVQSQSGDIHMGNTSPAIMNVQTGSGEISIDHVKGETALQIRSTSGDVTLANVNGKAVDVITSSGEVTLSNAILEGSIYLKSDSGDVALRTSDAADLYIQTGSGSVSGTLLSEKVFLIDTSSGDVTVPHSASGGKCEVTTQSGDIAFRFVTSE